MPSKAGRIIQPPCFLVRRPKRRQLHPDLPGAAEALLVDDRHDVLSQPRFPEKRCIGRPDPDEGFVDVPVGLAGIRIEYRNERKARLFQFVGLYRIDQPLGRRLDRRFRTRLPSLRTAAFIAGRTPFFDARHPKHLFDVARPELEHLHPGLARHRLAGP